MSLTQLRSSARLASAITKKEPDPNIPEKKQKRTNAPNQNTKPSGPPNRNKQKTKETVVQRKTVEEETAKSQPTTVSQQSGKSSPLGHSDDASSHWKPPHWQEILDNIREMRKHRDAPVDSMGAEKCSSPDTSPEVYRFHILVSLMLSSQTKDNVTYDAMKKLKEHGLTIDSILEIELSELQNLIYPVGFYKRKAEYLKKTASILKSEYNGDIPSNVDDLCKLPGVGPKMAYLCMDIAWNQLLGIGVDTHVHRISNRLGWTRKITKTPEATRVALESWLPKDVWREVNLLMVGFGQQVCLPVNPLCAKCLNKSICPSSKCKDVDF